MIQPETKPALTAIAKNRRYMKLTLLIEGEEYFEEEMVKIRSPLLYHMYVGRFSNRNADVKLEPTNSLDLSKFLFSRMDKQSYELKL